MRYRLTHPCWPDPFGDWIAAAHQPAFDPFTVEAMRIDALAGASAWERRNPKEADAAWDQGDVLIRPGLSDLWGCPPHDPVFRIRMAVAGALDDGAMRSVIEDEAEEVGRRERESRFRKQAERWRDETARLLGAEWDFKTLWAENECGEDWGDIGSRVWDDVAEARKALAVAQAAMEQLAAYGPPRQRKGGRADRRLERYVVGRLRFAWGALIGKEAPRSKAGPFVEFCAAAWRDVGLPEGEDLVGRIGNIADRRPEDGEDF